MKKVLLVLFLWLSGIVAGMQFAKFSSAIGLMQGDLGIDPLFGGWLLSSLGLIGILFGITSGVIVSRFSPIKMVVVFLWWAAAASLLQTMFSQPGVLLTLRVLEGFSQLFLVSAAPTALLRVTPKGYQAPVMTLWGTFFGMAFLAMNLAQGPLIALGGWQAIFYAHGIFAAFVALVLSLFLKTAGSENPAQPGDGQGKLSLINQHKAAYRETGSLLPGLLFFCHTLIYLVFLTYIPLWFHQNHPEEVLKGGFLLVSLPLFSLAGTLLSGVLLSKLRFSPPVLAALVFG